jgi:hypothetical protein
VQITTGLGPDTVNVRATGVATFLNKSGESEIGDTVNVGSGNSATGILGSVEDILGDLYIENNPPGSTTLNIDDSADPNVHTPTLRTITPAFDQVPWGSITGLAPAAINFEWADVHSPVNISTAQGKVSWLVDPNAQSSVVGVRVDDNKIPIN